MGGCPGWGVIGRGVGVFEGVPGCDVDLVLLIPSSREYLSVGIRVRAG